MNFHQIKFRTQSKLCRTSLVEVYSTNFDETVRSAGNCARHPVPIVLPNISSLPKSPSQYHPQNIQHSTPMYPTRSGVLCACVCTFRACSRTGIFRGPCLKQIQLGPIFDACMGISKTRPKQTARLGCLWASPSLGYLSCSCKSWTEGQKLHSVSATHCPSYSLHSRSSFQSCNEKKTRNGNNTWTIQRTQRKSHTRDTNNWHITPTSYTRREGHTIRCKRMIGVPTPAPALSSFHLDSSNTCSRRCRGALPRAIRLSCYCCC